MTKNYIEYTNIDLSHLEKWEVEAIAILKEAVVIAGDIYDVYYDPKYLGNKLYPSDVTREEVLKASENNELILNQYTIVSRNSDGDLQASYYHDESKEQIDQIVKILTNAADLYEQNDKKRYSDYLRQLCADLKISDYSESEIAWLFANDDVNVDIRLGPMEAYGDRLMGKKRSFQANLRIKDLSGTYDNIKEYIEVLTKIHPESPFNRVGEDNKLELNIRLDNVVAMSGWHAYFIPPANNYPKYEVLNTEPNKSTVLVYINNIVENDKYDVDGYLEKIMSPSVIKELDVENIQNDVVKYYALLNIAQAVIRYGRRDVYNRLGYKADTIQDLYSSLSGIKAASYQVLKGMEKPESYKNLLVVIFVKTLRIWEWGKDKGMDYKITFLDGYKLTFGYMVEHGAIEFDEKDKVVLEFPALFNSINELTSLLDDLISNGTPEQVEALLAKYSKGADHWEKYL